MTRMTSNAPRIALIGAGNMARALIGGLVERGHPRDRLIAADPGPEARRAAAEDFRIETNDDNRVAARGAGLVVLAVKPQVLDEVTAGLAGALTEDAVVVSIVAGVPIRRITRGLAGHEAVVRVMPNTPALFGQGASGLYAAPGCSERQIRRARELFEAVGEVFAIEDEALMDVVTAVSGSGPAYFFALAEALADAGSDAGLDPDIAARLAAQTAAGAGVMLAAGQADAGELRRRVTSPGGTTAAALDSFAESGLADIVQRAVQAAIARGRELGGGDEGEQR